jgi:hypothetical protein
LSAATWQLRLRVRKTGRQRRLRGWLCKAVGLPVICLSHNDDMDKAHGETSHLDRIVGMTPAISARILQMGFWQQPERSE